MTDARVQFVLPAASKDQPRGRAPSAPAKDFSVEWQVPQPKGDKLSAEAQSVPDQLDWRDPAERLRSALQKSDSALTEVERLPDDVQEEDGEARPDGTEGAGEPETDEAAWPIRPEMDSNPQPALDQPVAPAAAAPAGAAATIPIAAKGDQPAAPTGDVSGTDGASPVFGKPQTEPAPRNQAAATEEPGRSGPAMPSTPIDKEAAAFSIEASASVTRDPPQSSSQPQPSPVNVLNSQSLPAPVPSATVSMLVNRLAASTGLHGAVPAYAEPAQVFTQQRAHALQSLKIQLHPAELGSVTASLKLAGTQLELDLRVENAEAYHRLNQDADTIVRTFRAMGYDIDQVSIQPPQAVNSAPRSELAAGGSAGGGSAESSASRSGGGGDGSAGNGREQAHRNGRNGEQPGAETRASRGLYI